MPRLSPSFQVLFLGSLVLLAQNQWLIDARLAPVVSQSRNVVRLPRGGSSGVESNTSPELSYASSPHSLEEIVPIGLVGGAIPSAATENARVADQGASIPTEIFNLVKSIVGAGVLGLPAGTRRLIMGVEAMLRCRFDLMV